MTGQNLWILPSNFLPTYTLILYALFHLILFIFTGPISICHISVAESSGMKTCELQVDSQCKANYTLYLTPFSVQASTGKGTGREARPSVLQQTLTSSSSLKSESSLPHVDTQKDTAIWLPSLKYLIQSRLQNPFFVAHQFCMTRSN